MDGCVGLYILHKLTPQLHDAGPETDENIADETEDLQTLTFDDLLSFAYQVAKGMEFLSSQNVRQEGPCSCTCLSCTENPF